MPPRLVLVLPPVPRLDGRIQLTDKTLTGLAAFCERWPGTVEAVARPIAGDPTDNLGANWYGVDSTPAPVHLGDPLALLECIRPSVVQAPLTLTDQPAGRSAVPVVIVAENPAFERLRYASTTAAKSSLPRMVLGAARQHRSLRQVVRRAQAVACNGWAAWESFRPVALRHATAPLLYFDTRLRQRDIKPRPACSSPSPGGPLMRLAFSGRLHPAKGPQYAVEAARVLEQRGVPHHLVLIGAGPLEQELRERAGSTVDVLGPMPFDPTWVEYIRSSVDLMVLPHVQGDPSGTYLEAAGLGAPVVGFANRALSGHVRHAGLGWTVRRRDVGALADRIETLIENAQDVHAAGERGMSFMTEHSMELEFDRRVDQLLAVLYSARRSP